MEICRHLALSHALKTKEGTSGQPAREEVAFWVIHPKSPWAMATGINIDLQDMKNEHSHQLLMAIEVCSLLLGDYKKDTDALECVQRRGMEL